MSHHPKSFLFLIGLFSMCSVWILIPFLGRGGGEDRPTVSAPSSPSSKANSFRYAAPERREPLRLEGRPSPREIHSLERQLQRRARMETSGVVDNVIENPEMPEEVRSRFRKEKERLDALAEAHPDLARQAAASPAPRQVEADGTLSREFQDAVKMMKMTGAWDEIHETYLRQLEDAASDPDLDPEERPDPEYIKAVRSGQYIPAL